MINCDLINENIIHALAAIKNIKPTPCPGVWQIKNIFNENLLAKLQNHLDTVSDDCWLMVEEQENRPRRKLTWQADTVIEEIHEICSGLTDYINKRFSDLSKNFLGISIWKDQQGYIMSWHQDNAIIDIGMQIFLFDRVSPEFGTMFKIDEKEYLVPYISNTGYIIVQNQQSTTLHKPAMPLTHDQIRYSLYAVWSRFPKHTPDT